MANCACGSGLSFKKCCGRFLSGKLEPETPEQLVRARYTAFTRGHMQFLLDTHHPRTVVRFDEAQNRAWAERAEWLGFELVKIDADANSPDRALVEFVANYREAGLARRHHEISELVRENGRWLFVDGQPASPGLA